MAGVENSGEREKGGVTEENSPETARCSRFHSKGTEVTRVGGFWLLRRDPETRQRKGQAGLFEDVVPSVRQEHTRDQMAGRCAGDQEERVPFLKLR